MREGICGICPGQCHVALDIENGRIKKIKKSEKNFPSALCLRGFYSDEILNSPDRLKTPLIRTGAKGEFSFREASWDEAIHLIGERYSKIVEENGAQALASVFGRGGFENSTLDFVNLSADAGREIGFFAPLGSPNNGSVSSLCYVSFGVFDKLWNVRQ